MSTTESATRKAWRDAGRERYDAEQQVFAHLELYFDDPSDENLSVLQDLAEVRKRKEKAAKAAYKVFIDEQRDASTPITAAPMYAPPIPAAAASTISAPVAAKMKELEDRIATWDAEEKNRKDRLATQEAVELERLRRKQRPLGQKFMDWMNGK